jgi:outer membrane receptor protein involved in Fe transport
MGKFYLTVIFLCFIFFSFTQHVSGLVIDKSTNEPIIGARIESSDGSKAVTNIDGLFKLQIEKFPVNLRITMTGFLPYELTVNEPINNLKITMTTGDFQTGTVVVSASRRQQSIEEVPMSMDVLKADFLDSKGFSNLEDAVESTPGVNTMDGQVSIRGGSGYAYGVGSRVMLLWNGLPLLSGDAGDIKFNTLPIENTSQIEIIKGASSVLYGSGALNGVVALTEREPKLEGELRVKLQSAIYDNPRRESLQWYRGSLRGLSFGDIYFGKMYKNWGFSVSGSTFGDMGYREGETERRARVGGMIYFRPEKYKNIKAGVGYNLQYQIGASFLIWESDSLGFTPRGGADLNDPESTLIITKGLRLNVDPYIKIYDKKKNSHDIKGRIYWVDNDVITSPDQANASTTYLLDYQYQSKIDSNGMLILGASAIYADVRALLFGNHNSINPAIYTQVDYKFFKKLFITAGVRAEYFQVDGQRLDSEFNALGTTLPIYPIFRSAASYQAAKGTFFRTSWGQGVRFPSIAERFTQTSVGALNIFPNTELIRETGWAAEIGVKQVILFDKWKALIDVAGFWNEYNDMIEFTFGVWNPPGTSLNLNPNDPMYILNWVGFKAINAERAKITGLETTLTSEGSINNWEIRTLIGYTYMNPISLNNTTEYRQTFSDTTTNMLKYRFNHMLKGDLEVIRNGISFGISCRYTSFMKNIDAVFEQPLLGGEQILRGLKEYRQLNNKGLAIVDLRVGYKINDQVRMSFIVNNVFNTEYVSRPGAIQPPRMYMLQVSFSLK